MAKLISNYKQRWRKSLILIGGGNELGEAIANNFAHSRFRKWQVLNIDFPNNPSGNAKANENIIIKPEDKLDSAQMQEMRKQIHSFSEEYSAIINISQMSQIRPELGFGSDDIFDEYERIRDVEIKSSMLTYHLAGCHLSSNGYVCLSSTIEAMKGIPTDEEKAKTINYINRSLKFVQMQTALNLAQSRGFKDEVLYQNAQVNILLWDKLNTKECREKFPNQNYREWVNCDLAASLLKMWASGDSRPENGQFISFRSNRMGKEVYPIYY